MHGLKYKTIETCPECGSGALRGQENVRREVSIFVSDDIDPTPCPGEMHEVRVSELECADCGVLLIQDGEVIHGDYDA